jgi:isopenicillin N synthase-like dioxygenase
MVLSPHFRGYARPGWERTRGRLDWREQINIGAERLALPTGPGAPPRARLQGPNQWPAALADLKPSALAWLDVTSRLAIRLLQALRRCWGSPKTCSRRSTPAIRTC